MVMASQYLSVIYLLVIDMDNCGMTQTEEPRNVMALRRGARLAELIRNYFGDKQAAFVESIEGNQGEISALTGVPKKSFGEKKARALEKDANLIPYSLDAEEGKPFYVYEIPDSKPPISAENVVVIEDSPPLPAPIIDPAKLTPQQRMKAALVPLSVSAEALAGVAKVGMDVASQWLAGEGPDVSLAHAVAIQNTYQVNAVWLTKGKGEPGVAVMYNDEYRPIPLTKHWKLIPVVGMAQLGDNGHWVEVEFGNGFVDHPSRDKDAYALRCVGDSMSPKIEAGDFVIIEPNTEPKPGKNVLLKSKDGRVMVKKFLYKAAGRTYLVSVNAAHPPMSFGDEEIEKMHYVRAVVDGDAWIPE
jgi:hypothetical protein